MRLNFTTTWWQATTYLVGVTLFSISFLVFMNSAVSFVVTDVVGQLNNVGKAVGDLGTATRGPQCGLLLNAARLR